MIKGKLVLSKVSSGFDVVKVGKKLFLVTESELWNKDADESDDAERVCPKQGEIVYFDEAEQVGNFTKANLEKLLKSFTET